MSSATKCLIWPSKQARRCPFSILTSLSSGDDTAPRSSWRVVVAKSEPKMHAETLLRKLRLQEALSEDELNAYLKKVKSDGSLPTSEILILLELMKQRIENVSIEDIRVVSSLAGGNRPQRKKREKLTRNMHCELSFQNLQSDGFTGEGPIGRLR
jgi:hypothetical protein